MLEVTLHNNMHQRWATLNPPTGFTTGAPLPYNGVFPTDWPYDNTNYDWLNDTYSSHVNIPFGNCTDLSIRLWINGFSRTAIRR